MLDNIVRIKDELECIIDCIDDLVILIDSHSRIRRCNKALAKLMKAGFDELLGLELRQVLQQFNARWEDFTDDRLEVFHQESQRWFLLRMFPFLNNAGKIEGAVVVGQEFTALQKTASKLELANLELESKREKLETALAELKITQEAVIQQEKMATIGQLAAGVAHEINNPLGFIMGNLSSLQKFIQSLATFIEAQEQAVSALPEGAMERRELSALRRQLKIDYILGDIQNLAHESLDGAGRVAKIVQDLKGFSRKDESEPVLADLNQGLEDSIKLVWNEIKFRAELERDFGILPPVCCFPNKLNQVFMNLLVNAAQSIEGGGKIVVRSRQVGEQILVEVTDTGSGIPEELHERIFEPFFTTKAGSRGTGLGLSISYDIIKKHQGTIAVKSTPGAGTTFSVRIPVLCGGVGAMTGEGGAA